MTSKKKPYKPNSRVVYEIGETEYEVFALVTRDEVEIAENVLVTAQGEEDTWMSYRVFLKMYHQDRFASKTLSRAEQRIEDDLCQNVEYPDVEDLGREYDKYEAAEKLAARYAEDE